MEMFSTDTVLLNLCWWVQDTRAINSIVNLQNLLCTQLVLRVIFKTELLPQRRLLSIQPKSQTSTLTLSLHHCRPCSQSCTPSTNCWRLWGWGTHSRRWCRRCSGRRLSAQGHWSGSSSRSLEHTKCFAAALRPWGGEGGAPEQRRLTQGGCASLQQCFRRVVLHLLQIH